MSRLRDNEALIHPEHLAEVAIVVHGPEACVAEADTFVAEHYRLERVERYLPWVCAPPYWVDVAEDVAPRELLSRKGSSATDVAARLPKRWATHPGRVTC